MVSDHDRRQLFTSLSRTLGEHPATIMMELLPPFGWADVARQSDLAAIRGEMAELRGELKGEMAELRAELKGEIAELRGEMAELRGELHAQLPKLIAANIASMVGVSGLVLAAAALV
jgi:ribosomal protein L29